MKGGALLLLALLAIAQLAPAEETPAVAAAARPLADGMPEVAVVRLRDLLASKLSQSERQSATMKLGEALVAAGQAEEALTLLGGRELVASPELRFTQAQALAGLARWEEALRLYTEVANAGGSPKHAGALMGEAEALRALGRTDQALRVLTFLRADPDWKVRAGLRSAELLIDQRDAAGAGRLLDDVQAKAANERKQKRFLRARVEAATGHTDKALDLFASILKKPAGASHAVVLAALFNIAEIHLDAKTPESGDDALEDYIEHHPADSELPRAFAKLDQLYAAERKPSRRELARWASDPEQPRRALAQWYLARLDQRAGRRENALQLLTQLRATRPDLPALAQAYLELAQLTLGDGRFDDAGKILEEARSLQPAGPVLDQINLIQAEAYYRAQHWQEAAASFENAAHTSRPVAADAFFNASLAWLQLHDGARALADGDAAAVAGTDENARGDLLLEQGLMQAANNDKGAAATLQKFQREFPHHPRLSESWVALAEVAFHSVPPRVADAGKFLDRAAASQPNAAALERADYLRIWLADAAPDPNAPGVIALAGEFLEKHPASSFTPDVRMKLAEAYFRRQDFANAQTQFETLVQQDPNGPFAEKAQFFAAQSALQSMGAQSLDRALVLLDEVVRRNGELKWAARNEQASVERKLGKDQDALTLYDEVLKGDGKPGEKREALCGKADILYESAGNDRTKYTAAFELYQQLASEPNAPAHWKNQALFKAGMCLEKLNDRPRALETFYRVVEEEPRPDKPREYFWFYKAGFNAARLLEDDQKWAPAATVYQKLTMAGGERSDEARQRLGKLRLEHFLWEQ